MEGTIFDIKEMSIHDGPGVRVTVFLKGCPLHCLWCHNPEGIQEKPQLMVKNNLCTKCGHCFAPCTHEECRPFHRCIHACPNGCLSVSGKKISTKDLAAQLRKNSTLLKSLQGGITISGGEPLLQEQFVFALAEELGDMHKALQTSGFAEPGIYKKVISHFDFIMQDIKLVDLELHKKYTGVGNRQILENIQYLKKSGKEHVFRVPLIPGITDTEENLRAIAELVGKDPVELLPYNIMAGAKYEMLGMQYVLSSEPNESRDYAKYFKNAMLAN